MPDYYVKLGVDYDDAHSGDGLSLVNAWGGWAGAIRAIAAVTAGDRVKLCNHATPASNQLGDKCVQVGVVSTADMLVGEVATVVTAGGEGPTATIRIAWIKTDDYIIGEARDTDWTAIEQDDAITTPNGGDSTISSGATLPGLAIHSDYAASGSSGSPVTIQGRNDDDSEDEAAVLYTGFNYQFPAITINGVVGWHMYDVKARSHSSVALTALASAYADYWRFVRVKCHNSANGWYAYRIRYSEMIDCEAADNTGYGWSHSPNNGKMEGCIAHGNTANGIWRSAVGVIRNCLFYDNGGDGVHLYTATDMLNCVCDDNVGDGVSVRNAQVPLVRLCRLTNNGGYGLNHAGVAGMVDSDWNVYYGNTSGAINNAWSGPNDHGPAGSGLAHEDVTADGYTDQAARDYSLTATAILRRARQNIGIDGDNEVYVTAGFAPDDEGNGGAALSRVRLGH